MTYDSPWNFPIRVGFVVVIGLWRGWQMTRRPPTRESLAITVALLAMAASQVLEAVAQVQDHHAGSRTYITSSAQIWCLELMLLALCAYYAAVDDTRGAWRIIRGVAVLGVVTAVVVLAAGIAVAPGRREWDFGSTDSLRWYFTSTVYFPVATGAAGLLAARAARRARGALRFALRLGAVGLWGLAAVGMVLPVGFWSGHRHPGSLAGPQATLPPALAVFVYAGFLTAGNAVVVSIGMVALAHRGSQLRAMWRAWRDTRAMRRLRDDLGAVAPELSFPSTGWTPLLLKPHTARAWARIECRDRLVILSPRLATALRCEDYQDPEVIAAALLRLHRVGDLHEFNAAAAPVDILTAPDPDGRDQLAALARSYARKRKELTW